jgi:hypothetical protein
MVMRSTKIPNATMNWDAQRMPKCWYMTPATDGPMKAPKANTDVHNPEMTP